MRMGQNLWNHSWGDYNPFTNYFHVDQWLGFWPITISELLWKSFTSQ
jgi:hypothetical protein